MEPGPLGQRGRAMAGMIASELAAVSGFSPKEITDLANRGILQSSGGGGKGKVRLFAPGAERLCATAKMLMDDMGLPVGDAFRIAADLIEGRDMFGRFRLTLSHVAQCGMDDEDDE